MGNSKNSGSLGGSTNNPVIDAGTMARQEHRPPVPLDNSNLLWAVNLNCFPAHVGRAGVWILQDEYAKEIFNLWFFGLGAPETVFDNEKWANYMRNSKELRDQIVARLSADAIETQPVADEGAFEVTFDAYVGKRGGGYRTGYAVLHGSNRTVGNFQIKGHYRVIPSSSPGGGFTVIYENLSFVFNDRVDANYSYKREVLGMTLKPEKWLEDLAKYMTQCSGAPNPVNYTLRIKWKALEPIEVEVNGTYAIAKPWSG